MNVNDNINMEYEARVMVDEILFNKIKNFYISNYSNYRSISNHNFYYDTKELFLTKNHVVLRIRDINNKTYELTLKVKGHKGDIEINHPLSIAEVNKLKNNFKVENKAILKELEKYDFDLSKLELIVDLKTNRIEIDFPDYLLVIDENYYRNKVDYNLEVESSSKEKAEKYLLDICHKFNIEYKKDYISKSKRAIYNL